MQGQLAQCQQQLQMLTGQLSAAARAKQQSCALQMNHAASLAASLNPYGVLARGYALVQDEKGRICDPGCAPGGAEHYALRRKEPHPLYRGCRGGTQ